MIKIMIFRDMPGSEYYVFILNWHKIVFNPYYFLNPDLIIYMYVIM